MVIMSMPGQSRGVNRATTLRGMLWKKSGSGDVVFNPLTTPLPTRLGSRQGRRDTNSTTDLALVSPKIALWLCSEPLTPHTSDHLSMVFRLKKKKKKKKMKKGKKIFFASETKHQATITEQFKQTAQESK